MARYIDIEGAGIGKANREQFLVPEFADGWNAVLKILEKEPTADVAEVRHGRWIVSKTEFGWNGCEYPSEYTCSACGRTEKHEENFCPECGARMDGDDGETVANKDL